MATLTDLRKRLRGIQTICQLAGAMRTVSAAKLSRLNAATYAFSAYAQGCRELLAASGAAIAQVSGEDGRTLIVLLSGNRGLCGSYHNELFSFLQSLPEATDACYIGCGNVSSAYLRERGIEGAEEIHIPDVPEYAQAEFLTDRVLSRYLSGEVNRVLFVFSESINAMLQAPKCIELLPGTSSGKADDILWLPDPSTVREGLAEFCLRAQVYFLLLKCAMGVQSATLNSMRSAYDNGKESARELETAINRLRQTKVTASVIETSSGLRPEEEG